MNIVKHIDLDDIIVFKSVIDEYEPKGWVHISFDDKRNRKQVLKIG